MQFMDDSKLWKAYRRNPSDKNRNAIAMAYYREVECIAAKMHRRLGRHVEYDELLSAGFVGLLASIEKYDGSTAFATYHQHRTRGAMLDYVRNIDPCSRHTRDRATRYAEAHDSVFKRTGIPPTPDEVRKTLDEPRAVFASIYADHAVAGLATRQSRWHTAAVDKYDGSHPLTMADLVQDRRDAGLDGINREQVRQRVMRFLSPRERLFVTLFYFHGMPGREISKVLGVEETMVWNIRRDLLARLKADDGVKRALLDAVER